MLHIHHELHGIATRKPSFQYHHQPRTQIRRWWPHLGKRYHSVMLLQSLTYNSSFGPVACKPFTHLVKADPSCLASRNLLMLYGHLQQRGSEHFAPSASVGRAPGTCEQVQDFVSNSHPTKAITEHHGNCVEAPSYSNYTALTECGLAIRMRLEACGLRPGLDEPGW